MRVKPHADAHRIARRRVMYQQNTRACPGRRISSDPSPGLSSSASSCCPIKKEGAL